MANKWKFLHVGCGNKKKSQTPFTGLEWEEVRLDIDPTSSPDVVGSITDMSKIKDNQFDAIYSSHNIEHIYAHEVPIAFKEFKRVLKEEGFLILTCPDLKSICSLIAEDKIVDVIGETPLGPITPLDVLYGHRNSLYKGNNYMAHKCGFTENLLVGTLKKCGFDNVISKTRNDKFDLWVIASSIKLKEDKLIEIAKEIFKRIY